MRRRHVCLSGFCQLEFGAAGYALLSTVLTMRLARFCRQTHSMAQLLQPVLLNGVPGTMNLRGNRGLLYDVCATSTSITRYYGLVP